MINERTLVFHPDIPHTLVLGSSKITKDQMSSGLKKAIAKKENIIIVDPKDNLSKTAEKILEKRGYKICIFDFAKKNSCHYNPLLLNIKQDNAHLAEMMNSLYCDDVIDKKFWARAMDINLEGVMNYVQTKYANDQSKRTFTTAKRILWKVLQNENSEYLTANPMIYSLTSNTRTKVLTDSINIMDYFSEEPLSNLLSNNDPIFDEIIKETDGSATIGYTPKYAIIINFSPDNKEERILCNSLVSRLFAILCDRSQRPVRKRITHFFINDTAKLGEVLDMDRYVTVGRGYNTHIDMSFEDIEQMEEMYGCEHTKIISSNMNIIEVK